MKHWSGLDLLIKHEIDKFNSIAGIILARDLMAHATSFYADVATKFMQFKLKQISDIINFKCAFSISFSRQIEIYSARVRGQRLHKNVMLC